MHGEPTWGYLYRNFIPRLRRHGRVVIPDHMGFGKSETPQDRQYRLPTHVDNLAKLLDDLDLQQITLVGQDWGGPIACAYAIRNPERVKRFCLMNTLLGYGGATPRETTPWFQWIAKHYDAGTLDGILGELGSTVLSVMKILGFQNSAAVDDTWVRAYSAPFPDRESCVGGIEFPLDVHLGRIQDFMVAGLQTGNLDAVKSKPAMLAVGLEDRAIDPEFVIEDFRNLFPDGPVVTLPGVGHFCQEDAPQALVSLILQFLQAS